MDAGTAIDILIIDGSDGGRGFGSMSDAVLDGADRHDHSVPPASASGNDMDPSQLYRAPKSSSTEQNMIFHGTDENVTKKNINTFLQEFAPSRTPLPFGHFICVTRFKDPRVRLGLKESNMKALLESFNTLASTRTVTAKSVDEISKAHNVVSGKWVIFVTPNKVDALWAKVVDLVCVHGKAECANVRTAPLTSGDRRWNHQVICVWVKDYTDKGSVVELRRKLRLIGAHQEIAFKTDAYSYLGIYNNNKWGLRPGILYV